MMALRMLASWRRTWRWWCGAKTEMMRLMLSGASSVWSVLRTRWPGLGGEEGRLDRVQVAHLADEDDVGVLAEAAAQAAGEARDVHADLALADRALLVLVEVFDGVLDGDDVLAAEGVDVIDHGRQGRRLAASRRPRDEDEAALVEGDLLQDLGQEQLPDRLDLERDDAEGDGQRAPLVIDAAAEPAEPGQAVGQVDVEILASAASAGNRSSSGRRVPRSRPAVSRGNPVSGVSVPWTRIMGWLPALKCRSEASRSIAIFRNSSMTMSSSSQAVSDKGQPAVGVVPLGR